MIFLLEYDRPRGELVSMRSFPDIDRRLAADIRLARELGLHREGIQREVVLLQAASEDVLRKTHRHYFEDLATLIAEMLDLLAASLLQR